MGDGISARRLIALVAAYTVALQALLLPLSVAAAGPFANSLCSSVAADEAPPAGTHANGCPCAGGCGMQCCSHVFVAPPQVVVVSVAAYSEFAVSAAPPAALTRRCEGHRQFARGPPAV